MDSRQTIRRGTTAVSKADVQQVMVKIDRQEYRNLRVNLAKHGITVSSFFRGAIKKYLKAQSL